MINFASRKFDRKRSGILFFLEKEKEMEKDKEFRSALKVNAGIAQPPITDTNAIKRFKARRRRTFPASYYYEGIREGNIAILSQAITLVESANHKHQEVAQEVIELCLPFAGNSIRIGITGVPGVGKSTFVEAVGGHVTASGRKLAVLAVDPSSERSKGSILGDKTRMEKLSADKNAFIRPSPSSGSLGGVARKTRESVVLCEAAGFDTIFIETVGVGQSETAVFSMVDYFLLLMLAGAGDELQGIKRGIMEMADVLAITKADGNNELKAETASGEYKSALHLFPPKESQWIPDVLTCSSMTQKGIPELWAKTLEYFDFVKANGYLEEKRNEQAKYWMHETINEGLKNNFFHNKERKKQISDLENEVIDGKMSSYIAAKKLLDDYFKR